MADTQVQRLTDYAGNDLADLCDAADAAILDGGGFGWLRPPPRDLMEAYWRGVLLIPERTLIVGRIDRVIGGSVQLSRPPRTAEARAHVLNLSTFFVSPWARGHGLSAMMLEACEDHARREGYTVITLDVRASQERAIQVFEARGYVRWGVMPRYSRVGGEYVAGYYYAKDI